MTTPHPHSSARGSAEDAAPAQSQVSWARHLPTAGDWIGGIALFVFLVSLTFLFPMFH